MTGLRGDRLAPTVTPHVCGYCFRDIPPGTGTAGGRWCDPEHEWKGRAAYAAARAAVRRRD